MELEIFNNLRLEYSVGANVIIFSLVDTSEDKSVLTSSNVSKIRFEYSYNDNNYFIENDLNFHINSIITFIDNLPENTDITINPFLVYYNSNKEVYRIRLTETINEKTLLYGNIEYNIIDTGDTTNDNIVKEKII